MQYISLQYQWENSREIGLNLALSNGQVVQLYDDQVDIPYAAQKLSGLEELEDTSIPTKFIWEELKLAIPLLALDYLEERFCPKWLIPLYQCIRIQPDKESYRSGYAEIDSLFEQYQHRSRYPIVKALLSLFSDKAEDKLSVIGFIDKLGPAAAILINHKINEPNGDIKEKVRAAQQRFTRHTRE